MITPIGRNALHYFMDAIGVDEATLIIGKESFEYRRISGSEFQLGRVGDAPTNYVVLPGQEILTSETTWIMPVEVRAGDNGEMSPGQFSALLDQAAQMSLEPTCAA